MLGGRATPSAASACAAANTANAMHAPARIECFIENPCCLRHFVGHSRHHDAVHCGSISQRGRLQTMCRDQGRNQAGLKSVGHVRRAADTPWPNTAGGFSSRVARN